MLLTAATIVSFFLIALIAVGLGHYMKRPEVYFFGVVILLFMGMFVINNGIAVQTGIEVSENRTETGNETIVERAESFEFNQETDEWTNGIGLLAVVIAAGLSLTFYLTRKKEKEEKMRSIDLEE